MPGATSQCRGRASWSGSGLTGGTRSSSVAADTAHSLEDGRGRGVAVVGFSVRLILFACDGMYTSTCLPLSSMGFLCALPVENPEGASSIEVTVDNEVPGTRALL